MAMRNSVDLNDVKALIATLRIVYAAQFNKQFPVDGPNVMPMYAVEQIALGTLVGVDKTQFQHGMIRLNTSGRQFMPSFADFRLWCIGQGWWSAQVAWSKACDYTKIMHPKAIEISKGVFQYRDITTIAKQALNQVYTLILDGEIYQAKKQFIDLYESYVADAQLRGESQEWYQPPKVLVQKNEAPKNSQSLNHLEAQKVLASFADKLRIKPKACMGAKL